MKKLFIVFVVLAGLSKSYSQSYIPMIEDSMIVVNGSWGYDFAVPTVYKYLGDTVINAESYFRVFKCNSLEDSSFAININTSYYGAIREKGKKVFFLHKDSIQERKIYDFGLDINDTTSIFFSNLQQSAYVSVQLSQIDSISQFYGRNVRFHAANSSPFFPNYIIVEGVGNVDFCANEIETDIRSIKLCAIKKNNPSNNIPANYSECYWQVKNSFVSLNELGAEDIEIFPNPVKDNLTIRSTNSALKSVSVFDAKGKFIDQFLIYNNRVNIDVLSLQRGVYFLTIISEKGISTKKFVKN